MEEFGGLGFRVTRWRSKEATAWRKIGEERLRKFGQDGVVKDLEAVTVYKLADAGDNTRWETIGREVHGFRSSHELSARGL